MALFDVVLVTRELRRGFVVMMTPSNTKSEGVIEVRGRFLSDCVEGRALSSVSSRVFFEVLASAGGCSLRFLTIGRDADSSFSVISGTLSRLLRPEWSVEELDDMRNVMYLPLLQLLCCFQQRLHESPIGPTHFFFPFSVQRSQA
jgi:hypothetical protein